MEHSVKFSFCPECGTELIEKEESMRIRQKKYKKKIRNNLIKYVNETIHEPILKENLIKKIKIGQINSIFDLEYEIDFENNRKNSRLRSELEIAWGKKQKNRQYQLINELVKEIENTYNIVYIGLKDYYEGILCYFIEDYDTFNTCKIICYKFSDGELIFTKKYFLKEMIDKDWIHDNVVMNIDVDYDEIREKVMEEVDMSRLKHDESILDEIDEMVEEEAYRLKNEIADEDYVYDIDDIKMDINISENKYDIFVYMDRFSILDIIR